MLVPGLVLLIIGLVLWYLTTGILSVIGMICTIIGVILVIIVWGASQAGLEVPAEVASAFTTLLASGAAFAAGYYKSNV